MMFIVELSKQTLSDILPSGHINVCFDNSTMNIMEIKLHNEKKNEKNKPHGISASFLFFFVYFNEIKLFAHISCAIL